MKSLKLITLALLFLGFFVSYLSAAKPAHAGNADKQKTVQTDDSADSKAAKKGKSKDKDKDKDEDKDEDEGKGQDQGNSNDKTDAERKEAGKGSETGQQNREAHSRKWWKFWGDDDE